MACIQHAIDRAIYNFLIRCFNEVFATKQAHICDNKLSLSFCVFFREIAVMLLNIEKLTVAKERERMKKKTRDPVVFISFQREFTGGI